MSEKGDDLVKQAEKRLKAFTFFSSSEKYEDAVDLFDKAAAQYKITQQCKSKQISQSSLLFLFSLLLILYTHALSFNLVYFHWNS
jgi:hypothetical protein